MKKHTYIQPATAVVMPADALMEVITISGWVDDPGKMESNRGGILDDEDEETTDVAGTDSVKITPFNVWAWDEEKI